MAIGALLTTVASVAPQIISAVSGGGGGGGGPCPGAPSIAQVDTVRRLASPGELQPVVAHWDGRTDANRKPGQFLTVPAAEIIGWLMGGHDCKHGDARGAAVQSHFQTLVQKYDGSGAMTVAVTPQLTTGAQIQQAVQPVVSGAVNYAQGVVAGGVTGAATAAQAGGAAAQASRTLTELLPLLAVLALAVVIVLKR